MKFPKRLRHRGRGKVWATIYRRSGGIYRLYWRARVDGKPKSLMQDFPSYAAAKRAGDTKVAELAKGTALQLSPKQAADALAALQRLDSFYQSTGRRVSLLAGISEFCEAAGKLTGHTLAEVVERFKKTEEPVKRKALADAVTEYLESRKHLAVAKDGKRSRHSPVYERHVATWLTAFARTFPGYAVCDLTREHMDTYVGQFKELSGKSRNDRRAVVRQFVTDWCVPKDFLPRDHRLFEAVGFKNENSDVAEIDYYRPKELRKMLDAADAEVLPVVALGGLAGLRREEIIRLEWADVWRVKGKIEISARIAKGRKRRLVTICPALVAWLKPYRNAAGLVWSSNTTALEAALRMVRETAKVPSRRNGLRHAFVTFHFAKHNDENLTAAEAGNSPQMLHEHYRGLSTSKEAAQWFGTKPARAKTAENVIQLRTASNG